MIKFSVECTFCGAEFHIVCDEEQGEIRYCPFCGEEIIQELNFD